MKQESYLDRRQANFRPLTPIDFLDRTATIYPHRTAVIWGDATWTYAEFATLVVRFAAMLVDAGIESGDVVSIMAPNRPELLAAHYAAPLVGAVLSAINVRLEAETIGHILNHSGSRLFIVDPTCAAVARAGMRLSGAIVQTLVLRGDEPPDGLGDGFDALVAAKSPMPLSAANVEDEWAPICLNYTSGTTGLPKGVIYHHRGAYLNAIGNVLSLGFSASTTYLWTLPMFHCNGWCHTWAVTAAGGTHVCLEAVNPSNIFRAIERYKVTHFCCAPAVLYMLLNHPDRALRNSARRIKVGTGGASPTSALLEQLEALGIDLVHLYGLTESYGPATICELRDDWDAPTASAKARALARQGVRHSTASQVRVIDERGGDVANDGSAMGEIVLRGNTLMAGYYKDEAATEAAFANGHFHTGDLAVRHPDGYLEIKDRSKDIIISGGENVSSLEIESVLQQYPSVMLAAVVAAPDPMWGEVPYAYIELKPTEAAPSPAELSSFCRQRLAGFKVPKSFIFCELPKTATGKIQKHALRAALRR